MQLIGTLVSYYLVGAYTVQLCKSQFEAIHSRFSLTLDVPTTDHYVILFGKRDKPMVQVIGEPLRSDPIYSFSRSPAQWPPRHSSRSSKWCSSRIASI